MLTRLDNRASAPAVAVPLARAAFPAPFPSGLEYGAPARGPWNIVHTGMLVPQAHEIFVCASNCLRGVVLTAAEMNAAHRFSTVTIRENNVLDGDMEELIVEGVTHILQKLPALPPAVLVYTSCIHHFMGCDLALCYRELRSRFPQVDFTDCYMNPIMRKSGLTPDQLMRRQLYSLLRPTDAVDEGVNILGCNLPTDESSDLVELIEKSGHFLRDITLCRTYDEYQEMARSGLSLSYLPPARAGGDALAQRLGRPHLHLPLGYGGEGIRENMRALARALGADYDGGVQAEREAMEALRQARQHLGDIPIAIDYTATPAPLGLARLLLSQGFAVRRLYADAFTADEREDFLWLQEKAPELELYPTIHPAMRVLPRGVDGPWLAIGQKAAYFTSTGHFINMVEGGGMYGFDGIRRLAGRLTEAFDHTLDTPALIQQKGLGCACCL